MPAAWEKTAAPASLSAAPPPRTRHFRLAGIDLGLTLVERLRGRLYAEALMLQAEYQPAPPFPLVTPESAEPALVRGLHAMCGPLRDVADLVPR